MNPSTPFRYKGFLSYSHADRKFARKLHRYLESFRVPAKLADDLSGQKPGGKKLGAFFLDREELPSASDLSSAISSALDSSEFLIVLCSPQSANSRYVNQEILEFKRRGRSENILCIIVDSVSATADPLTDCFSPALRYTLDQEGELSTQAIEPIAADARPAGDGYRDARLKLVAGLLGVGLDQLRQRELQRHNRRLMGIAGASLAGMLFTIGLSMIALDARDEAQRHREEADKLIGFMLGDLRTRLDEVGRLDILDSVVDKTISYFQNLPEDELNVRTRMQRAAALTQLGQVMDAKGEALEANALFATAHKELHAMCGRIELATDEECLFQLAQAQFWLANGDWLASRIEAALEGFNRYAQISARLTELAPGNKAYQVELAYGYNNLAVLHNRLDNAVAANELNSKAIALGETLAEATPNDLDIMLMLAEFYSWSAEMLNRELRLQAAMNQGMKYLELAARGLELSPQNTLWLDHLMMAERDVGRLKSVSGLLPESETHFWRSLETANSLVSIEPENQYWQVELAVIRNNLISVLLLQGDTSRADQLLEQGRSVIDAELSDRPDDIDWLALEFGQEVYHLQSLLVSGRTDAASALVPPLMESGRALLDQYPQDESLALQYCEFLLALAELSSRQQNPSATASHANQALNLLNTAPLISSDRKVLRLRLTAIANHLKGISPDQNKAQQQLLSAGYNIARY